MRERRRGRKDEGRDGTRKEKDGEEEQRKRQDQGVDLDPEELVSRSKGVEGPVLIGALVSVSLETNSVGETRVLLLFLSCFFFLRLLI